MISGNISQEIETHRNSVFNHQIVLYFFYYFLQCIEDTCRDFAKGKKQNGHEPAQDSRNRLPGPPHIDVTGMLARLPISRKS